MKKQLWMFLVLLVVITAIVAACAPAAQPTKAPATQAPTAKPTEPPAEASNETKLLFLGNENIAPVVYLDGTTPSGVAVDIVRELAKHIPQPVEIKAMDWSEAQALVARGEADALIQINPTEERKKIYDFSDPLLESHFSIFTSANRMGISGISSLRGLQVGVESGGLPQQLLEKDPQILLTIIPNFLEGFKLLNEGSIDAVVVDYRVGSYVIAENNLRNIKASGESIASSYSSFAVKKGNTKLLNEINSALQIIKADGSYQKIIDKWEPTEVVFLTQEQITERIFYVIIVILFILFLLAVIWMVTINKGVIKRKVAEEKLREEYSTLFSIINSANALIFSVDRQYRYTSFNQAHADMMKEIYGAKIELGHSLLEYMIVAEDMETAKHSLDRALAGEQLVEEAYSGEEPRSRKYFQVLHNPIKTDGEIIGVAVLAQDMTERKRAENALKENERVKSELLEKMDEAQHIAMIGSWEWNLQTNLVWWSDEIYRIFGVTPQDFVPSFEANSKFVHPDDFAKYNQSFEHSLQTGEPLDIDIRLVANDGLLKNCHAKGKIIGDDSGQPIRFIGTMMDITERKRVEEALYEQQQVFRTLVENSPDIIARYDLDCQRTYVNPVYLKTAQISQQELLATSPIQLSPLPAASATILQNLLRKVLDSGVAEAVDVIWPKADKIDHWYNVYASPEFDREGRVVSVMTVSRDITERKRAEEERKAQIHFLESLGQVDQVIKQETNVEKMLWNIVNTVFSIFDCDRAWLFYPCDPDVPSFRVPVEINRPEYPGANVKDIDVPMSPDLAQNLREALESDDPVTYTIGTDRPINKVTAEQFGVQSQMFIPLYPKVGKPWVFGMHQCSSPRIWTKEEIKLFKEISRRISDGLSSVLFLRELQENEERFRATFEQAAVGIAHVAPNGRWLWVNQKLCDIVGYSKVELLQKTFQDITYAEDLDVDLEYARQVLAGEIPTYGIEKRYIRKDGSLVWVNLTVSIVHLASDEPGYFIFAIEDITERKRVEEEVRKLNQELEKRVADRTAELEYTNKELEAFAYSVSHDLRAPLRHINGYIDLLQVKSANCLDEQSQHYMTNIALSSNRMGALIDDLLSFSRLGRNEMIKMQVDLGILVKEVIDEFKPETEGRDIQWSIADLPIVIGDRALLRVVMVNLISNALKFTKPRQSAKIEIGLLQNDPHETVLFVRDNGVGFDMSYADKLFNVFQRLHRVEDFEGSGIGLANVRRIINRHGGKTWAEGKVDGGATFYISLPKTQGENS